MNGLYFLVPFLLIASVGLMQDSLAIEYETGYNYDRIITPNLDGTQTVQVTTHPPRVFDGEQWQDFVEIETNFVETGHGKVRLNSDGSYTFYNGDTPLLTDSIIVKYADISDLDSWTYPDSINNAVPITSWTDGEFTSSKSSRIGLMEYKYISTGNAWKTQLEATNLSGLTTKVFGFDQIIDLNRDTIVFGDQQRNLDNFDGVTFDKAWLQNNEAKVIGLLNGHNFDFDLGFEDLHSVTVFDTGANSSRLVFDFRTDTVLLPNETLIIDPTFTDDGYEGDDFFRDSVNNNGSCDAWGATSPGTTIQLGMQDTASTTDCYVYDIEFDFSAFIDPSITNISNVVYTIEVTQALASGENFDIRSIDIDDLSTRTDNQRFNSVQSGSDYYDAYTYSSTGTISVTLNSLAESDILTEITTGDGIFAMGMHCDPCTQSGVDEFIKFDGTTGTNPPELSFTYVSIIPPNAVEDLTSTSIGSTTIDLDWTEPELNGESLIGYQINYTTPQSQTVRTTGTVFLNDTGTIDDQVTGLTPNTPYSFTVSAWTAGGNNATFANVYNATTLDTLPSQPTNLVATASSESVIGLDWDDSIIPLIDNLTGYRIFIESPVGNGWTLEVNDTGTTTSSYSDTSLTTKTQYNYMVAGINATGVGTNSTASNDYTWGVPDGITGFTIINPTVSTLDPDYTAAVSYGYPVTGYETLRDNVFLTYQGNVTTFTDTGLDPVTSYEYSIRALSSFGNSTWVNATGTTVTSPPTSLIVNDCYHTCTTQLNLEWVAPVPDTGLNGYKIERETPIGGGWSTLVANTTTTTLYHNDTSLTPGQFYNYRLYALTPDGESQVSNTYAYSPHRLPDPVDDLAVTTNELLQFILSWTIPDNLYGTLSGYNINYTTPAGDPLTVHIADSGSTTTSATVSGLDPTVEFSFRVSAVTNHGTNVTNANIENSTLTNEIEIGDITISTEDNPNVIPISYVLYGVDSTTDDVQVRYDAALTVDCNVSYRIAGTNVTHTGLSETVSGSYVYHNFTVTNAGNDILDFDCYDQTDGTINGQYSLTQSLTSSGVGGVANVPLFAQITNFTGGMYGTEGDIGGIDLMTMFIVIVSMLGFNRTHPALGVGVMTTMLGAAWYFELVPWTSGVLGGIAMVMVLAIGMGLKKRD